MNFLSFAIKNPFRSKLRTFFIIVLLVMGILSITASMALSHVSTQVLGDVLNSGGGDLQITDNGSLTITELNNIKNIKGVQESIGVSSYIVKVTGDDEYSLNGYYGKKLEDNADIPGIGHIKLIDGVLNYSNNEVILTKEAAEKSGKKVGDLFTITKVTPIGTIGADELLYIENMGKNVDNIGFKVVGIVDNLPNMSYGLLPIETMHNSLYGSSELKFDSINVKADKNQLNTIKKYLNDVYPSYVILESGDIMTDMGSLLFYIISFFVVIGAVIMMLTTFKSVNERTKEIGTLKAIGWSNKRVVSLILAEASLQLMIAWIIALIIICIFIYSSITEFDTLNLIKSNISTTIFILSYSFVASLCIPFLGCLLPLLRVTRLKPTEALKYE